MNDPAPDGRRRGDGRPMRPALIAPTTSPLGPVPDEVRRSIDVALERARAARRHVTLVAVALPEESPETAFRAVCDALRKAIRSGDGLWCDGQRSLVTLLADVDGPGAMAVLDRLEGVLAAFCSLGLRVGRASAPPGIGALDLLDLARVESRQLTPEG